jgi:hypothetical protein
VISFFKLLLATDVNIGICPRTNRAVSSNAVLLFVPFSMERDIREGFGSGLPH